MKLRTYTKGVLFLIALATASAAWAEQAVSFNRDIRPLLADRCFTCHGPDENTREADLRLDQRESATRAAASGERAIVPGDVSGSALIHRVTSADEDLRMPPVDGPKRLTDNEIELLKTWIAQGAEYQPHWSFVAPRMPDLPKVASPDWCRNDVDRFVLAKLEAVGKAPSREASRETLIRRVAFDLTGLPPTLEEIDGFLSDDSAEAYGRMVDRYLASSAYGEHMARHWLDLARYADTNGYQYDTERTQWVWRDWVIDAYNRNQRFDEFTVEQLAGDLLPDATDQQRLATGFNRNHGITIEGGIIDEEYRTEYVMDRLVTTGEVWLGLTVGCARCHEHKFDPISQREFYQLYAFFNQVAERGMRGFDPQEKIPSPLAVSQQDKLAAEIAHLQEQLESEATPGFPATMVMRDLPQSRDTFVLERGEYNKPTEKVSADVPAIFPAMPADAPKNRLGFARWLVSPKHPLTARVAVNRYWQRLFGIGLVKTSEDFGVQGELPSHPDLLDWLAKTFVNSGWDVKRIQRLIVTSATYRQTSHVASTEYREDPENRLLARGPRMRLDAEEIRDAALAVSGALVEQVGGQSVYPYQPAGLWLELNNRPNYSKAYPQGSGDDLYRRSLYTFWKRTVPSPMLKTFDAPEREFCTIRRSRTNTPLQALLLLNGPQFVEAARLLAERMMEDGGASPQEQIAYGFRLVTARSPRDAELILLLKAYKDERDRYSDDEEAALGLLGVGKVPTSTQAASSDLAAMTTVARLLLNLNETITKG